MRGYSDITRSTSACVHFVQAHEVNSDLIELKTELVAADIFCAYVDCRELVENPENTCDAVAIAIGAEHAPYGEEHWIRLLDDMITLSKKQSGLVIVLDHADQMLYKDKTKLFDLSETFLIQFHHWLAAKKPCHLCFQISPNPMVEKLFG